MSLFFQPFDPHGRNSTRIRKFPLRLLLPNLITVLAICSGISGIRLAFENRFEVAVVMVLIAAFLDGFDGRFARMLKATSKFGAHMDSLADIVNFGVAPALVLYLYLLRFAGSFGWVGVLVFVVACALRLARFNVLAEDTTRTLWQADYFVGVPAPAGAVLLLLPVYLGFLDVLFSLEVSAILATFFSFLVSFLLVSRLPVYSGKKWRIRRETVIPFIFAIVVFIMFLSMYTWETLTFIAVSYLICIPFSLLAYTRQMKLLSFRDEEEESPLE